MAAETDVKQVIIIRRDLGMRRGKEIAQGAHASMAFISQSIREAAGGEIWLSAAEQEWFLGKFAKIVLQVETEEELRELYRKAREARLEAYLITDSGRTEFAGVPTITALAIGPDYSSNIDPITKDLKLY